MPLCLWYAVSTTWATFHTFHDAHAYLTLINRLWVPWEQKVYLVSVDLYLQNVMLLNSQYHVSWINKGMLRSSMKLTGRVREDTLRSSVFFNWFARCWGLYVCIIPNEMNWQSNRSLRWQRGARIRFGEKQISSLGLEFFFWAYQLFNHRCILIQSRLSSQSLLKNYSIAVTDSPGAWEPSFTER